MNACTHPYKHIRQHTHSYIYTQTHTISHTHGCRHTHRPIHTPTCLTSFLFLPSDPVAQKGSKSPKLKPGSAANGKGVNLQKEVSLAATNPRGVVNRPPGPRGGPPGNIRGPQPGPGRGRGRGGPPPRQ